MHTTVRAMHTLHAQPTEGDTVAETDHVVYFTVRTAVLVAAPWNTDGYSFSLAMNAHTASFADVYEPVLQELYRRFCAPVGSVRLQRPGHVCTAETCKLVSFVQPSMPPQWGDVFLCLYSNNVHFCGSIMCDLKEEVVLHEGIDNHYVCPLTHMYIAADMDRYEHVYKKQRRLGNADAFDEDECLPPFPGYEAASQECAEQSHTSDGEPLPVTTHVDATAPSTEKIHTRPRVVRGRDGKDPRDVHRRSAVFRNLLETIVPAVRTDSTTVQRLVQQMERVWAFLNMARQHEQGCNKKAHLTPKSFALWFVHCLGRGWSVVLFGHSIELVPCHVNMAMGPVKRNAGYVVNDHTVGEKAVQFLLQRVTEADVLRFVAEGKEAAALRVHDPRSNLYCLPHRPLKKSFLPPALPQPLQRHGHQ